MTVKTFTLPDLGEGLTEAELVSWLVQVGDTVAVDQPIAEVETAKSAVEVPCPFAGTVHQLHGTSGQTLDVGAPLISVDTADRAGTPAPQGGGPKGGQSYREEERAGADPAAAAAASAVAASVRKTGRVVVVAEAPGFASVAAEIVARVQERCFHSLAAPVRRVTGFDIPYPAPKLEEHYLPSVDRILDAVDDLQWED